MIQTLVIRGCEHGWSDSKNICHTDAAPITNVSEV
jgi:hypothetical protein